MKKAFVCVLVLTCLLTATPIAQSGGMAAGKKETATGDRGVRTVKGRTLVSTGRPAVRLKFGQGFRYVGTQSFILYDVAHAEQHFFVDADKQGRIRRLYWVQFEGYLPDNSHTYNYGVNKTAQLGGYEFIADSRAFNVAAAKAQQRPGSDGARARDLLANKGLSFASGEALWQRLVHMVDSTKRDELMIIYMEDLGGTGLTAADLSENGKAAAQWEAVSKGLLERALKGVEIEKN